MFSRKEGLDPSDSILDDHSRVIYLMSNENRFMAAYSLDISESELAEQIIEEISYDIGTLYIGTGGTPIINKN